MKKQQTIPSSFDSFIIEFEDVNYKIHKCNLDKYSNSYLATKYEKDLVINLNSNNLIKAIKLHNAVIVYSKYHTLELMNYYILE